MYFTAVKLRNVTWASDYSLLLLDNPVGAGFSFTADERGYPDNEDDVRRNMSSKDNQAIIRSPKPYCSDHLHKNKINKYSRPAPHTRITCLGQVVDVVVELQA